MRHNAKHTAVVAGIGLALLFGLVPAPQALGQEKGKQARDPRVQQRTYQFKETKEELPYAVFVSSKVDRNKKSPLIIALHGLGGNPNTLMRRDLIDLAEAGGYIVFARQATTHADGTEFRGPQWLLPRLPMPRPPKLGKADPAAANDPPNLAS